MPNSKDLQGLQIRQTMSPTRQLLFYSPNVSFMCAIKDGHWILSSRVTAKALPEVKALEPDVLGVVRLECANEQLHTTTTFYVPPIEYLPAFER